MQWKKEGNGKSGCAKKSKCQSHIKSLWVITNQKLKHLNNNRNKKKASFFLWAPENCFLSFTHTHTTAYQNKKLYFLAQNLLFFHNHSLVWSAFIQQGVQNSTTKIIPSFFLVFKPPKDIYYYHLPLQVSQEFNSTSNTHTHTHHSNHSIISLPPESVC